MNLINFIEIPVDNFENAKKFYGNVFKWKIYKGKSKNSLFFEMDNGLKGSFIKNIKPLREPGIIIYIEVDDIDSKLKEIEQAGGKIKICKTPKPEVGYYALFNDHYGNILGLISKK